MSEIDHETHKIDEKQRCGSFGFARKKPLSFIFLGLFLVFHFRLFRLFRGQSPSDFTSAGFDEVARMPDRRVTLALILIGVLARAAAVWALQSHTVKNSTYEHGPIAANLLAGRGFSVKFLGADGPTSQQAPVYPLIVAAAYAVGGVGTPKALLILELGQSVLGGLLVGATILLARESSPGRLGSCARPARSRRCIQHWFIQPLMFKSRVWPRFTNIHILSHLSLCPFRAPARCPGRRRHAGVADPDRPDSGARIDQCGLVTATVAPAARLDRRDDGRRPVALDDPQLRRPR